MNYIKPVFKIILVYILRCIMRLLYIFPLKENRIVFNSYRGQQYACNPKYITEFLIREHPGEFEIYWAFNNPDDFKFLEKKKVKLLKYVSFRRLFIEATAKFSINNIGSYSWLPKRNKQEHINTWHGSVDYKKCALGESANNNLMKKTLKLSTKETSLFFSANRFTNEVCIPNDFGYKGYILDKGVPRNDIFFDLPCHNIIMKKIREQYNVEPDSKIVLYAPTWRYGIENKCVEINWEKLLKVLNKKLGKVTIFCRSHHITGNVNWNNELIIDVSGYKDSQELMIACDMMITDYSSMIWDYSLLFRPIILFAPDLEKYQAERGFNIDIYEWGFPVCQSENDLMECITEYNFDNAARIAKLHHKKLGNLETGHSTEYFYNWMKTKMNSFK